MEKGEELFQHENEVVYTPFDYINKDLDLLFLLIFIEAEKEGKDLLCFADFFKGDYWDHGDVRDEVMDTNDYLSVPDMVFQQVIFIFEDTRLGEVVKVGLDNTDKALADLLVQIAKIGSAEAEDLAPNYLGVVEQIIFLKDLNEQRTRDELEKHPEKTKEILRDKSAFFTPKEGYFRKLQEVAIELPQHIFIKVRYDKNRLIEIKNEIVEYLEQFSRDELVSELPAYKEKRLYFAQQIENFYRFVSRLNLIGDTINIPFSILKEEGFEAVKILKYLELKHVIKMRWSDEGSWKVQFTKLPITPDSLLGNPTVSTNLPNQELKFDLSFIPQTGILNLTNSSGLQHKIKIQGQVQKEVLRVIFQNPKNTYSEWSLSDVSEILGQDDVNETAVKNALYQLNKKVRLAIPSIENFFDYNKYSAKINSKYLSRD